MAFDKRPKKLCSLLPERPQSVILLRWKNQRDFPRVPLNLALQSNFEYFCFCFCLCLSCFPVLVKQYKLVNSLCLDDAIFFSYYYAFYVWSLESDIRVLKGVLIDGFEFLLLFKEQISWIIGNCSCTKCVSACVCSFHKRRGHVAEFNSIKIES